MTAIHGFYCGPGALPAFASKNKTKSNSDFGILNPVGDDPNVHIHFDDISDKLRTNIPDRLFDWLEIASYVYTADCATRRGTGWLEHGVVEKWDRAFEFVVAVRDLSFWKKTEVREKLSTLLQFISNDDCKFSFVQRTAVPSATQLYFDWQDKVIPQVDKVVMFSGGLDSLAGAVELASSGENLLLVSHRPVSTMDRRQKELVEKLRQKWTNIQVMHVPIWVNKKTGFGAEPSQRTRSFLFAALGTLVAKAAKVPNIYFCENGVLSLNLQLSEEILRARASRTTHPHTMYLLQELSALVADEKISIVNPFIFKTKKDIVSIIAQKGCAELIAFTKSCSHTINTSKNQWHCGTCSQCIDRRIAVVASDQQDFDDNLDYVSDVFTGIRSDGYEKNIAIAYCRNATELNKLSREGISQQFNTEIVRATRHFGKDRVIAANRFIDMYQRHVADVCRVLEQEIQKASKKIVAGGLEPTSLLSLLTGQEHQRPLFQKYFDRISAILKAGIPSATKSTKPKTEPELQELCDGLLKASDEKLSREFPYVRWSFAQTKPDFSSEYYGIWIEIKYARKDQGPAKLTDDIAADLTKYGDANQRVLFVTYDPDRRITNDDEFLQPVRNRDMMGGVIIR